MTERPHKRLVIWQKTMRFIEGMYRMTERFPREERFGLVSQMRRAAVSIATNIAEGAARQSSKETTQYFFISRGSISELDTQVEIAHRLGFIDDEQQATAMSDLGELSAMINGLISRRRALSQSLNPSIPQSLK